MGLAGRWRIEFGVEPPIENAVSDSAGCLPYRTLRISAQAGSGKLPFGKVKFWITPETCERQGSEAGLDLLRVSEPGYRLRASEDPA